MPVQKMRVWRNGRRISDQLSSFNYESAAGTEDVTTLNDDVETMAATGLLDRIWAGVGWYDDPIDAAMRAAGSRMTWCYGAADGARAVHSERAGQYSYKPLHPLGQHVRGEWSGKLNDAPWGNGYFLGRVDVSGRRVTTTPSTSPGSGETIEIPSIDLGSAASTSETWVIVAHILSVAGAGGTMRLGVVMGSNGTTWDNAPPSAGSDRLRIALETTGTVIAVPSALISAEVSISSRKRYLGGHLAFTASPSQDGGCVADVFAFNVST